MRSGLGCNFLVAPYPDAWTKSNAAPLNPELATGVAWAEQTPKDTRLWVAWMLLDKKRRKINRQLGSAGVCLRLQFNLTLIGVGTEAGESPGLNLQRALACSQIAWMIVLGR